MHPPVDYPVLNDERPQTGLSNMTYAGILERYSAHEVITDAMIQSASISMETAQQVPSVARAQPVRQVPVSPVLQRLFSVIR